MSLRTACPINSRAWKVILLWMAVHIVDDPGRAGRWGFKMLDLLRELVRYMSARKKWWLLPVIVVLLLVGGLLILAQNSAIAPFIYTVF